MKKQQILLVSFIFWFLPSFAQQIGYSYQTLVSRQSPGLGRDVQEALKDQEVRVRFTLRSEHENGPIHYQEEHDARTNAFGILNAIVGSGLSVIGSMKDLTWTKTTYYLQVELDVGEGFQLMSNEPILIPPHAKQEDQELSLNGTILSISGDPGSSIDLESAIGNEGVAIDELQTLEAGENPGELSISEGNTVVINTDDEDSDPTNENQVVTAGNGIDVVQVNQKFTVTNTAPDQEVSLVDGGAGNVTIGGSYPDFTIDVSGNGLGAFSTEDNVTSNVSGDLATDDFVFGSSQLDDDPGTIADNHKMIFDKDLGAFYAGNDDGSWASRGAYSIGLGYGSVAEGEHAVALGAFATAQGHNTLAFGNGSIAEGIGGVALGSAARALGHNATAIGFDVTSEGISSLATGLGTVSSGTGSSAMGLRTNAPSYAETVIGSHSTLYTPATNGAIQINASDRLFVIGNGVDNNNRSDALVMLKNGYTTLNGTLTIDGDNEGGERGYTLPAQDGEAHQVLTSEGDGTTSWQSATGDSPFNLESGVISNKNPGTEDFIFGSPDIYGLSNFPVNAVFFDKSKGAFRVGLTDHQSWAEPNVGFHSFAAGFQARASGQYAMSLGINTSAVGSASTSLGIWSTSQGLGSVAMGYDVMSGSLGEVALGLFNTYEFGSDLYELNDRLFVIGNGMDDANRSDALVIHKDGSTTLYGELTIDGDNVEGEDGYRLPQQDGSSGQVMITDGSGSVEWQDLANENQTVSAGTGISVNQVGQDYEVTNTAPDQTVSLSAGVSGNVTIAGTYPNFTIDVPSVADGDSDDTNENQTVSAGTGISVNQVGQDYEVTNTAPDLTVSLIAGVSGNVTIAGTYPNFTIDASGGGAFSTTGNVTSNAPGNLISDDFVFGSSQLAGDGNSEHEARFFFSKDLRAFRAGSATGTQWDEVNVGGGSAAFGTNSMASGSSSFAAGSSSEASGSSSIAVGSNNVASGNYSVAMGIAAQAIAGSTIAIGSGARAGNIGSHSHAVAIGWNAHAYGYGAYALGSNVTANASTATALGTNSLASGYASSAIGNNSTASGHSSFAAGHYAVASGDRSSAFGTNSQASGLNAFAANQNTDATGLSSFATGSFTDATGSASSAFGARTIARSYGEMAIGLFNVDYAPNETDDFDPDDRLFVIGNGEDNLNRSNALIVHKNGNTEINGELTVDPANDDTGYTLPIADGTANQVLTSAGDGTTSWQTPIGGSPFLLNSGVISNNNPATEDFVFGSDQLNDDTGISDNIRMLFDKSTGAFRVGNADGTSWDTRGANSIALGFGGYASNTNTVAIGNDPAATGLSAVAIGSGALASGNESLALGSLSQASGYRSFAFGPTSTASASSAIAFGVSSTASGLNSLALSSGTAIGTDAVSIGGNASGNQSVAIRGTSTGVSSITLGVGSNASSFGEVATGIYNTNYTPSSMLGFSIGDRIFVVGNGLNNSNRSDALIILKNGNTEINGELTIDPDNDDSGYTLPVVDGTNGQALLTDGMGNLGWGVTPAASAVFSTIGNVTSNAPGDIGADSFVFGSNQMDNNPMTSDDDDRMFFNINKYAFRAGSSSGVGWDDISVGIGSAAFGEGTEAMGSHSSAFGSGSEAHGHHSFAAGYHSQAHGLNSVALGANSSASNTGSVALGVSNISSGQYSFTVGQVVEASGNHAAAFGLGTIAQSTASVAIGQFNLGLANSILEVGNGADAGSRSNVFTIYESGDSEFEGDVGIGTTPDVPLHVIGGNNASLSGVSGYVILGNGNGTHIAMDNNEIMAKADGTTPAALLIQNEGGDTYISSSGSDTYIDGTLYVLEHLDVDGDTDVDDLTVSGTFTNSSDSRLKQNIQPISSSLKKIQKLEGVNYNWNTIHSEDTLSLKTGFIAQEIEKVFPELVSTGKNGYKQVSYLELIPHLVEAVKELKVENDKLKVEVSELKAMNDRIDKLELLIKKLATSPLPNSSTAFDE